MNEARFWFDGKFDVFLPPERREVEFSYSFKGNPSVKHLIEAMRVPHTEVGQVIINENPKSITDLVQNGDFIVVCPVDCNKLKNTDRVIREAQGDRPGFILDNHLGKLATYLRMLGFDTLYRNDYQDEELAAQASQQERILLTRDRGLLMRREIAYGYYIRSMMPQDQIVEVLKRYQIVEDILPFKRCLRCNDVLLPVEKALIMDRLEPLTRTHYNEFHQCRGCHIIYWKGSHYERMLHTIDELKTKAGG